MRTYILVITNTEANGNMYQSRWNMYEMSGKGGMAQILTPLCWVAGFIEFDCYVSV